MQRNKQVAMGRKKFNMDPKKVINTSLLWSWQQVLFRDHHKVPHCRQTGYCHLWLLCLCVCVSHRLPCSLSTTLFVCPALEQFLPVQEFLGSKCPRSLVSLFHPKGEL